MARLRAATTLVYGVDQIRLYNGDYRDIARFRLPRTYFYTQENEQSDVRRNRNRRMQVIRALTDRRGENEARRDEGITVRPASKAALLRDLTAEELSGTKSAVPSFLHPPN